MTREARIAARAARRLAGVVAAVSAVALGACKEAKKPPVARGPTMADSAEQVLYNVKSLITHDGVQRGELLADTGFVFNDQTRFVFLNARVVFNKETGAKNGDMRADRGIYDMRTQVLEGFGNVRIKTTDGKSLAAPQLRYNQITNEISSDSAFKLVDGDRVQEGVGFRSDPNLSRFQVLRGAKGRARGALTLQ